MALSSSLLNPVGMNEDVGSKHFDPEEPSITDDFCYHNNVAQAHVYIRLGFLRKVYGLLSVQLLLTSATAAFIMFTPSAKEFVQKSDGLLVFGMFMSLVTLVALFIKRHDTPHNFFLLAVFTVVEAYTIGVVISFFDIVIVLQAFFLTLIVSIALTIYTLQSKKDLSQLGLFVFAGLCVLLGAGLLQLFLQSPGMEIVIAAAGAILFSLFIIYDTHMMMHKLSPEEYILATINLYLDIINLFLHILRFLNSRK